MTTWSVVKFTAIQHGTLIQLRKLQYKHMISIQAVLNQLADCLMRRDVRCTSPTPHCPHPLKKPLHQLLVCPHPLPLPPLSHCTPATASSSTPASTWDWEIFIIPCDWTTPRVIAIGLDCKTTAHRNAMTTIMSVCWYSAHLWKCCPLIKYWTTC